MIPERLSINRIIYGRCAGCVLSIALVLLGGGAVVCAGSPRAKSDPAAEAAFLRAAGEGFELRTTAHFLIAHEGDPEALRDFIARIEATYRGVYRFLDLYDLNTVTPPRKLEIFFFDHPRAFFAYGKRTGADVSGAAGFYSPKTNRAAFYHALNMPRLKEANEKIASLESILKEAGRRGRGKSNRRDQAIKQLRRLRVERDRTIESVNQLVVQHEVAHQVLYNAGLHVRGGDHPTWLVEGLACLFETPPGRDGAGFAAVNQYRLGNFRDALGGNKSRAKPDAEKFKQAQRLGRMVPLRRLIGDGRLFETTRHTVEDAYAQAWSLVYYLHRRKRQEFADYLAVLASRPARRAYSPATEVMLFEKVFGPIDDAMVNDWLEFCDGLKLRKPR